MSILNLQNQFLSEEMKTFKTKTLTWKVLKSSVLNNMAPTSSKKQKLSSISKSMNNMCCSLRFQAELPLSRTLHNTTLLWETSEKQIYLTSSQMPNPPTNSEERSTISKTWIKNSSSKTFSLKTKTELKIMVVREQNTRMSWKSLSKSKKSWLETFKRLLQLRTRLLKTWASAVQVSRKRCNQDWLTVTNLKMDPLLQHSDKVKDQ